VVSAVLSLVGIFYRCTQAKYAKQQLEQATKIDERQINIITTGMGKLADTIKESKTEVLATINKAKANKHKCWSRKKSFSPFDCSTSSQLRANGLK